MQVLNSYFIALYPEFLIECEINMLTAKQNMFKVGSIDIHLYYLNIDR